MRLQPCRPMVHNSTVSLAHVTISGHACTVAALGLSTTGWTHCNLCQLAARGMIHNSHKHNYNLAVYMTAVLTNQVQGPTCLSAADPAVVVTAGTLLAPSLPSPAASVLTAGAGAGSALYCFFLTAAGSLGAGWRVGEGPSTRRLVKNSAA